MTCKVCLPHQGQGTHDLNMVQLHTGIFRKNSWGMSRGSHAKTKQDYAPLPSKHYLICRKIVALEKLQGIFTLKMLCRLREQAAAVKT